MQADPIHPEHVLTYRSRFLSHIQQNGHGFIRWIRSRRAASALTTSAREAHISLTAPRVNRSVHDPHCVQWRHAIYFCSGAYSFLPMAGCGHLQHCAIWCAVTHGLCWHVHSRGAGLHYR